MNALLFVALVCNVEQAPPLKPLQGPLPPQAPLVQAKGECGCRGHKCPCKDGFCPCPQRPQGPCTQGCNCMTATAKAKPYIHVAVIPAKSLPLRGAKVTQSIFVLDNRDVIEPVGRSKLEEKWQVPGGMVGVTGWEVEKWGLVPERPRHFIANIAVKNSFGFFQDNRGIRRRYPDGTRFDEVLKNAATGEVFEHRVAEKTDGVWKRYVAFSETTARPKGYHGLKQTCASCHDEAGTGGYAVGLVPGGDTVISDPLDEKLFTRGVAVSAPVYQWVLLADDADQVALYADNVQVGVWRHDLGKFRPYDARADKWGEYTTTTPVEIPERKMPKPTSRAVPPPLFTPVENCST